jgi:tRNA pseudouridine32 synthase / 23S rRNA pseudouridine746 synthase
MDPVEIIFRHKDFIVANKPCDSSFHDEEGDSGFFNIVAKQLDEKLWPVHRLDKLTSGLILLARSKQAAAKIGVLFEKRLVSKTYLAISDKKPKKKQGRVIGDMKKSRSGNWMLCRTNKNPAITKFKSLSITAGIRLFLVTPMTGKTHQIRVALKSLGSPIIGDTRYSGSPSDRCYLHAYQLEFEWKRQIINIQHAPTLGRLFCDDHFKKLIATLTHKPPTTSHSN